MVQLISISFLEEKVTLGSSLVQRLVLFDTRYNQVTAMLIRASDYEQGS